MNTYKINMVCPGCKKALDESTLNPDEKPDTFIVLCCCECGHLWPAIRFGR